MVVEVLPLQLLPLGGSEPAEERMRLLRERRESTLAEAPHEVEQRPLLGREVARLVDLELGGGRQVVFPRTRRQQLPLREASEQQAEEAALERQLTGGHAQRLLAMSQHLRQVHSA